MKKFLSILLVLVMVVSSLAVLNSCGGNDEGKTDDKGEAKKSLSVGVILVGDETEGYSLAHMNGIEDAVKALEEKGYDIDIQYKKKVGEDETVESNAKDLIANGCSLIITNSYGHQFHFNTVIEDYPDVQFVSMTGDLAAGSGLANYANAFTNIYESRYVSGVAAGLKIKALLDDGTLNEKDYPDAFDKDGNIKVGYVGAYAYQEVVSGYTAFYLGIKSVVENVAMTVKYTNSWFSEEREAAVAEYLMSEGCVIIGQHADSTGAPSAVQKALKDGSKLCFSIGYNVSMLDAAPDAAITSATNNWGVYYTELFTNVIEGKEVPTNWAKGYVEGAVATTDLGTAAAEGTAEKLEEVRAAIIDGSLKVFDCSKFTVGGKTLTTYTDAYQMDGQECLKTENGVTYFEESTLRSAPYFDIRIDGITEIDSDYAE